MAVYVPIVLLVLCILFSTSIALEMLVYSFVPFTLLYTPASLPQSTFTPSYSYFRLDHCTRKL